MKTNSDLKPTDRMLLNAINFLVTLEQGEEMILERLINGLSGVEKSRQKKRMMILFEHIADNDKLELNDASQKVLITHLKTLGIFGTD
jgi:ABC-type transporter Mla maintaining outer membrane lipid asymmetry ATPase subunit MlaF